ncbi:unnamed protein product [Alternaria alternata]|uniref:Ecp2 effector protein domain-containing protein n=2 Tax=Alternaria alternata complex TaxID=187734 RepID=A0A177D9B1_ALTAL|nr:hypothetical protein CC77DRAFT_1053843 [Alternaria alternata]XP_051585462.1 uncharacterized protein J4E82_008546 [Alternaria postmessia]RII12074.1 hypothetical protein CUC08_Gglean005165 [Alternaria sp. MG1]RYN35128.1 hypothetical protein AA0115_g2084 [Alternaria tenuissima]KAH6863418.1 hypothetical protein B0T12DRAFT_389911 [Alternaria alternata]KAI5372759.1 hypothetical protein J4E82_008546 [Alternaria postmessia]OAG15692.1 hypothetical protein CC77DRAFT_1053843 [Alternaria alternata]
MKATTILATLSLAALGAAMPSPDSPPTDTSPYIKSSFSWVDWVDSLIADPSTALSAEEALAAFEAGAEDPEDLTKRQEFANCQQLTSSPPSVGDAVSCINDLAGRGKAGQNCDVSSIGGAVQCSIGSAHIVTVRGGTNAPTSVNCNDIARSGGIIMDRCTRGDNTVSGTAYIPQGGVAVHIQHS